MLTTLAKCLLLSVNKGVKKLEPPMAGQVKLVQRKASWGLSPKICAQCNLEYHEYPVEK